MTPMERIQQQLRLLPLEKQSEVLDFVRSSSNNRWSHSSGTTRPVCVSIPLLVRGANARWTHSTINARSVPNGTSEQDCRFRHQFSL